MYGAGRSGGTSRLKVESSLTAMTLSVGCSLPVISALKGRYPPVNSADDVAVEGDRGLRNGALEVEEQSQPLGVHGGVEVLAVDPDLFPGGRIPVLPGQRRDGVRERDRLERAVVEPGLIAARHEPAEQPARVERDNARSGTAGTECPNLGFSGGCASQTRCRAATTLSLPPCRRPPSGERRAATHRRTCPEGAGHSCLG